MLNAHLFVVLLHVIVLSVAAFSVIPPPSPVSFVGVVTLPKIIFLSSTSNVSVFKTVCVPFTVKFPETTISLKVTSLVVETACPIEITSELSIVTPVPADNAEPIDILLSLDLVTIIAVSYTHLRAHET